MRTKAQFYDEIAFTGHFIVVLIMLLAATMCSGKLVYDLQMHRHVAPELVITLIFASFTAGTILVQKPQARWIAAFVWGVMTLFGLALLFMNVNPGLDYPRYTGIAYIALGIFSTFLLLLKEISVASNI